MIIFKTMKLNNNLTVWDKIIGTTTILCFIFWILAKIPEMYDFIPFGIVYESVGWLISPIITVLCSLYFLIKWVMNKFTLNKIYLYGFLLGLITLYIMRFIFSITTNGIVLIND